MDVTCARATHRNLEQSSGIQPALKCKSCNSYLNLYFFFKMKCCAEADSLFVLPSIKEDTAKI